MFGLYEDNVYLNIDGLCAVKFNFAPKHSSHSNNYNQFSLKYSFNFIKTRWCGEQSTSKKEKNTK